MLRPSLWATSRVLLLLAFLGFISLGLPDGLLGVGWPSIRATFALPLDAVGALFVTFTSGYVIASFSSGWLMSRMRVGTLLAASGLLTGLSLLLYAASPSWGWMVATGLIAGCGAGAIDAGINTFAANYFSTRVVYLLHAFFGVGAAAGPMIMTAVLAAHLPWQRGYVIVGIAQLVLALCFALTRRRWPEVKPTDKTQGSGVATLAATLKLPGTQISAAVFVLYTAIESTAGVWIYSLLAHGRGVTPVLAATAVSVFWCGLTGARLLFGIVAIKGSIDRVLSLCASGMFVGAALLLSNLNLIVSLGGAAVLGFACGPFFPLLIAATPQRLGAAHTANAVGVQIASAALGLSVIPSVAGVLADKYGLEMIPWTLTVLAVALIGGHRLLVQVSR
jgi:fucose permease